MRNIALALMLCLTMAGSALASDQADSNGDGLDALIARHSKALEIRDGKLAGPGGEWLAKQAGSVRFTLFGESHMTREIPELATGLWRGIAPAGYEHLVIETSPLAARTIERLLRSGEGDYERYLADGRAATIPFYNSKEEIQLLETVVGDNHAPALWGVDQIFVAGGVRVLERLLDLAQTGPQREAAQLALEKAKDNPHFVAAAPDDELVALEKAFAGGPAEAADLVAELARSHDIYQPFSGGGSIYLANRDREQLMKRHFVRQYRDAAAGGRSPKVMLKTGEAEPCQGFSLPEPFAKLVPEDGYRVFDLAALRPHASLWNDLDPLLKSAIWSYDALIAVPNARPATPVADDAG